MAAGPWQNYAPQAQPAPAEGPWTKYAQVAPTQAQSQPPTWMDKVSDFAGEWWKQVNPVAGIKGLAQAAAHPITTGENILQAQGELKQKAEDAFKRGDYAEGVRHVLNYLVPVLGPQSDVAGTMLQNPQTRAAGLGMTAGIGTNLVAPELLKGKIPIPGAISNRLQSGAEELYQGALKPPITLSPAKTGRAVQAGLENQIPVSQGGVAKLGDLIDDLNDKIKQAIPPGGPRTISPSEAVKDIGQVSARFATQVNPASDLAAIEASKSEFLDQFRSTPGGAVRNMTPEEAQAMKQGTYAQLKGRAYGELKSATIESQKALARGLKEELVKQFPELQGLNAQEGKMLDLQPILDRAVQRIGNHQLIGIGTPIGVGATKALTGSAGAAAVAGAIKAVIDNPWVKSELAFKLYQAGKAQGSSLPLARFRVQGYVNALGQAVAAANNAAHGAQGTSAPASQ